MLVFFLVLINRTTYLNEKSVAKRDDKNLWEQLFFFKTL